MDFVEQDQNTWTQMDLRWGHEIVCVCVGVGVGTSVKLGVTATF